MSVSSGTALGALPVVTSALSTDQVFLYVNQGGTMTPAFMSLADLAVVTEQATIPIVILKASTTDTTPWQLTLDGSSGSASRSLVMPNLRGVLTFTGRVTAQDDTTGDMIAWDISGAMKRPAANIPPAVVGNFSTSFYEVDASMAACSLLITGGANGPIIQGVGITGRTLSWNATLTVTQGS